MIVNITYPDRKTNKLIEEVVGSSFSIMERIKLKGVGSSKLQIIEASEEIDKLIGYRQDTAYSNIELRKKGVVVGFNCKGRIYALCIPYYQLNIYYNHGQLSVYGPKNHIKAKAPFNGTIDKKFLRKVLKLKAENSNSPYG